MAAKKKINPYIDFELEWLETKAKELKKYVDDRPLDKLIDRDFLKQTSKGGIMHMIASTVEQQRADLSKALKDYVDIITAISTLREKEEQKLEKRGGGNVAGILEDEE